MIALSYLTFISFILVFGILVKIENERQTRHISLSFHYHPRLSLPSPFAMCVVVIFFIIGFLLFACILLYVVFVYLMFYMLESS